MAFTDITVKKADGTTNVTFNAIQRSAGDKSPARYAQLTGFPIAAKRPQLAINSQPFGTSGLVRRVSLDGVYPIQVTDGAGNSKMVNVALKGCTVLVPLDAPSSDVKEGIHQLLNVAASAVFKETAETTYAPA